jgi:hypothetical protein
MDKVNLTRETLAALAPKLASLSEEILFGDIWQRPRCHRVTEASSLSARWSQCIVLNSLPGT